MKHIKNAKDIFPVIKKEDLIKEKGKLALTTSIEEKKELTGAQKAALFLISLGSDTASNVLKYLKEDEVEKITSEIAKLSNVSPEIKEKVLQEFQQLLKTQEFISQGGIEYARDILVKALGEEKANKIINRLKETTLQKPFQSLKDVDAEQLKNAIANEHPQTIALILSYIDPKKAAEVLKSLPPELQTSVVKRMATMDKTAPNILKEVERVLMAKLTDISKEKFAVTDGISTVANILNKLDSTSEKHILETLEEENPELADKIKDNLFVFDDIVNLDDIAIQLILREIEQQDLVKALKGASQEIRDKFFRNMSKRTAQLIKEDIEFLGPIRLREVEEARQKILNVIRKLESEGKIIILKNEKDEIII